jgi:hypothetical protein
VEILGIGGSLIDFSRGKFERIKVEESIKD